MAFSVKRSKNYRRIIRACRRKGAREEIITIEDPVVCLLVEVEYLEYLVLDDIDVGLLVDKLEVFVDVQENEVFYC